MARAIKAALAAIGLVAAMSAQAYFDRDYSGLANYTCTVGGGVSSNLGAQFEYLDMRIYTAKYTNPNNQRDRDGMRGKLSDAAQKVGQKKLADADAKLEEIYGKADDLASATKPKIDRDDAGGIMQAVDLARECLSNPT